MLTGVNVVCAKCLKNCKQFKEVTLMKCLKRETKEGKKPYFAQA